jgi:gamma-butyrobetaine dioxygenase
LRDNCANGFHPDTQERHFDLLGVGEDIHALRVSIEGEGIVIDWSAEPAHRSRFAANWLADHRPGHLAPDPADIQAVTWGAEFARRLPRFQASDLLGKAANLRDWLITTKRSGISIVEGLTGGAQDGIALGERVGLLRETIFGRTFQVENKPNPINLAYTALALPLHSDLANQELPPGFQFLHCIANEAKGGDSRFADGFRIAENLRQSDFAAFDLLTRLPVPYRYHDSQHDIRIRRPLIGLDECGRTLDIRYNAHLADSFDMAAEAMIDYYRAFRVFMAQTRDPNNLVRLKLRNGEMAVFDNRRILHGRGPFDPASGYRLLNGFYVDRGEFDSRIRRLTAASP